MRRDSSPHDDEDVPPVDRKTQIAHDHKVAIGHGEVFNGDMGLFVCTIFRHSHVFISSMRFV